MQFEQDVQVLCIRCGSEHVELWDDHTGYLCKECFAKVDATEHWQVQQVMTTYKRTYEYIYSLLQEPEHLSPQDLDEMASSFNFTLMVCLSLLNSLGYISLAGDVANEGHPLFTTILAVKKQKEEAQHGITH